MSLRAPDGIALLAFCEESCFVSRIGIGNLRGGNPFAQRIANVIIFQFLFQFVRARFVLRDLCIERAAALQLRVEFLLHILRALQITQDTAARGFDAREARCQNAEPLDFVLTRLQRGELFWYGAFNFRALLQERVVLFCVLRERVVANQDCAEHLLCLVERINARGFLTQLFARFALGCDVAFGIGARLGFLNGAFEVEAQVEQFELVFGALQFRSDAGQFRLRARKLDAMREAREHFFIFAAQFQMFFEFEQALEVQKFRERFFAFRFAHAFEFF